MASSLLDSLTALAGPSVLNTAASQLGESPEAVSRGLTASFGAILSGLFSKVTSGAGLQQIFDLIRGNANAAHVANNPSALANILSPGSASSDGMTGSALHAGKQLLSSVFGGNTSSVANLVAQSSGLRSSSASSLMGLAAPLVLGVLGKRASEGGMNLASFSNSITSEKDTILRAAPAGMGNLSSLSDAAHATAGHLVGAATATTAAVGTKGRRWLWPVVVVVALFALLWGLWQRNRVAVADTMSATADTLANMGDSARSKVTAAVGTAAASLGQFVSRTLPNGTALNVPEHGIESTLIGFITDGSRPVSDTVWFNFDRMLFETGSATLRPESQEQAQNVANILKAYPNVSVKIGGYTDNTGDPAANLRLSQQRADAVRAMLVTLGIAPTRLASEGYGDAHPVADNSTDAGRAQNRRIALRVTKK